MTLGRNHYKYCPQTQDNQKQENKNKEKKKDNPERLIKTTWWN
nr:hypothetical protein [Mycoplasmopsis bovis]